MYFFTHIKLDLIKTAHRAAEVRFDFVLQLVLLSINSDDWAANFLSELNVGFGFKAVKHESVR